MVRITVFLTVIFLQVHCFAQDRLFALHPLVGDTIDKTEKLNYFLFPHINDSDFRFCTLTHSKDGYFANGQTIFDAVFTIPIDSAEMRQTIERLDKLMQFYSNQEKKDTVVSVGKSTPSLIETQPDYAKDRIMDARTKDKIVKETRSTTRLRDDAERQKQVRQGTDITGGGMIEVFRSGRKKRK